MPHPQRKALAPEYEVDTLAIHTNDFLYNSGLMTLLFSSQANVIPSSLYTSALRFFRLALLFPVKARRILASCY